ncbi:hypothetical protein FRC08_013736 [Ceratobasidium sp. 394]|nr:hypothetical protein FRC08_013736 [Ceratobasidium sp. 394]
MTPYGALQSLKAAVWTHVFATNHLPVAQWTDDEFKRLLYKGQPINISDMPKLAQQIRADIEHLLYKELFFGIPPKDFGWKWHEGIPLVDNLSNLEEGYSVFSEQANREYLTGLDESLLSAFMKNETARKFFTDNVQDEKTGEPVVLPDRVREWTQKWARLQEMLALLMHILGGQPARSTELLACLVHNISHHFRHLYWFNGQFFFIVCVNKAKNISPKDRVIVHGLPKELNEILLLVNAVVRPAVAAWTYQLNQEEKVYYDQLKYLFSCNGNTLTITQLSRQLRSITEEILGVPLGIADWRHISIIVMRRYFQINISRPDVEEDSDMDKQAGHGTPAAWRHYGTEPMEWHLMRDNTISKYIDLSRTVSDWYLANVEYAPKDGGRKRPHAAVARQDKTTSQRNNTDCELYRDRRTKKRRTSEVAPRHSARIMPPDSPQDMPLDSPRNMSPVPQPKLTARKPKKRIMEVVIPTSTRSKVA